MINMPNKTFKKSNTFNSKGIGFASLIKTSTKIVFKEIIKIKKTYFIYFLNILCC